MPLISLLWAESRLFTSNWAMFLNGGPPDCLTSWEGSSFYSSTIVVSGASFGVVAVTGSYSRVITENLAGWAYLNN